MTPRPKSTCQARWREAQPLLCHQSQQHRQSTRAVTEVTVQAAALGHKKKKKVWYSCVHGNFPLRLSCCWLTWEWGLPCPLSGKEPMWHHCSCWEHWAHHSQTLLLSGARLPEEHTGMTQFLPQAEFNLRSQPAHVSPCALPYASSPAKWSTFYPTALHD